MCNTMFAALLGLVAGCGAPPVPAGLLAPADPHVATRWRPPPSPTAGLRRYEPVEARSDWGGTPPSAPDRSAPGGAMPGMNMPGIAMPGMGK